MFEKINDRKKLFDQFARIGLNDKEMMKTLINLTLILRVRCKMARYRCTICGGTADNLKICCGKEMLKIIEQKMPKKTEKE